MIALLMVAEVTVDTVKNWEIVEGSKDCLARGEFKDGTTLEIGLAHSRKWSSMVLWNDRWKSVSEDKKYNVRVQFDNAEPQDVSAEGMTTADSGGLYLSWDDYGILPQAMSAHTLRLWNGDSFIGGYSLAGTKDAILQVARCSGRASVQVKEDPFAQ